MWLSKMLFPSRWCFFPPLRIGMNSSTCWQPPTASAVCHSGLLHFSHRQQEGTFLFTRKCTVPLHSSVPPSHHSGPLNVCAATHFSDMLEGSHTLCSGSYPQVFGKCSAHLMCLQPTPSFGCLSRVDLLSAFGHVLGRGLDHRSQVKRVT